MSTFVSHMRRGLSAKVPLPSTASESPTTPGADTQFKQELRAYYLGLSPPHSLEESKENLHEVRGLSGGSALAQSSGREEGALQIAIAAKLTVGIYTQFLEVYLNEASDAEAEMEWWSDIERSRWRTTYFLLQSECLS